MREASGGAARVLVAADSALARAGLEAVVKQAGTLTLAGSAVALATVVRDAGDSQPDAVLLSLSRDDEEHLTLISALSSAGVPAVVVLAEGVEGPRARELLRRGARAVLPSESAAEEIVAAVLAASAGLVALRPEAVEALIGGQPRGLPSPSTRLGSADGLHEEALTPREQEVIAMVAEGLGNKEIAWRLRISEHTVKFHVASILSKLGAASRTEAVALGVRRGLILL
jgi:two-component system, NarL family, response regulator YdfI